MLPIVNVNSTKGRALLLPFLHAALFLGAR